MSKSVAAEARRTAVGRAMRVSVRPDSRGSDQKRKRAVWMPRRGIEQRTAHMMGRRYSWRSLKRPKRRKAEKKRPAWAMAMERARFDSGGLLFLADSGDGFCGGVEVGVGFGGAESEGWRIDADRNMSCHGRLFGEFESSLGGLLEYGTSSILEQRGGERDREGGDEI